MNDPTPTGDGRLDQLAQTVWETLADFAAERGSPLPRCVLDDLTEQVLNVLASEWVRGNDPS
ncbi:hypothetical protein AB6N24_17860 [Cellulomonas sp. 179-A 4D5 NHS]|uniref:hypothetical protein n=1 Tax=Cellulomonas sp. 179-A 4D5 NHS TaxID=3142378 RepID=UPI0039A32081